MTFAAVATPTMPEFIFIDDDRRDAVAARRNVLMGLWAAARMGLGGAQAEAYAWSVHFADLDEPGHDDVVAKVQGDLQARGIAVGQGALRRRLREMELRAELQLLSERS